LSDNLSSFDVSFAHLVAELSTSAPLPPFQLAHLLYT
jgi:hypothetical protein